MKAIIFTLILVSLANAQSSSTSDLCNAKKKQYSKDPFNFISCNEVDWGIKPMSADFQPVNFGPMNAVPSQFKDFKNPYPGILNTEYFSNGKFKPDQSLTGLDLSSKFISEIAVDPNADHTAEFSKWLETWRTGLERSTEITSANAWVGKCDVWAGWSMDPKVHQAFSGINKGIICNGIPFTRGELKELVTSLYPMPMMNTKTFDKFAQGYMGANPDMIEDANVALSKLGVFGRGELNPGDLIQHASETKLKGENLIMDRDPGYEIWNQPIQKITDVAYTDGSENKWQMLTSAEFTTVSGKSDQFLSALKRTEADLTEALVASNGISQNRLCELRVLLSESCDGLSATTLTAQVDEINRLKQEASSKNLIKQSQAHDFIKHEMIIEYGTESAFASNAPDQTIVQSYSYTSVNQKSSDGSVGKMVRSQWSPQLSSLNKICANPALAESRNLNSMTRGFKVDEKCEKGKVKDPNLSKREYFTGAVPPNAIRTYKAEAMFTDKQANQRKAYEQLLQYISKCDRFDGAVDFLQHLTDAALDNVISASEAAALNLEFSNVKPLMDSGYATSLLKDKYQGVQGLGLLKFN